MVNTHKEKDPCVQPVIAVIGDLRRLNTAALKIRYRELFGAESRSSNKQFLFRRIAWRLQANDEGDLSERAHRRAAEIADDGDIRTRSPPRLFARQCLMTHNILRIYAVLQA